MFFKISKIVINTILAVFILIGVLVVFSFVPFPGNYKVFSVQSGSMEPTISTGSIIFVRPSKSYQVDDIITRRTLDPKITVTHRITEQITQETGETAFKTKGDANNSNDAEFVSPESIVGKTIFSIPYLGYPVSYAKTERGLILFVIIPAVVIIYEELQKIIREIQKKISARKESQRQEASQVIKEIIEK